MSGDNWSAAAAPQLRAIVERVERLEDEKKAIADDIKDVYAEAKANGFDTAIIRQVVRLRRQDAVERAERQAMLDLYLSALGMLADTPLGQAAAEAAASGQVDLEDVAPAQQKARRRATTVEERVAARAAMVQR